MRRRPSRSSERCWYSLLAACTASALVQHALRDALDHHQVALAEVKPELSVGQTGQRADLGLALQRGGFVFEAFDLAGAAWVRAWRSRLALGRSGVRWRVSPPLSSRIWPPMPTRVTGARPSARAAAPAAAVGAVAFGQLGGAVARFLAEVGDGLSSVPRPRLRPASSALAKRRQTRFRWCGSRNW